MDAHRARAVILVLATATAACHQSSTTPKGDPVPREAYVDTSIREICAALESCCSSRGFHFNAEDCASNVRKRQFSFDEPSTFCPAPAVYDAQAAGKCLAEKKAALSSCALDPAGTSATCWRICTGTVAAGQACTNYSDCAGLENGWVQCSSLPGDPGTCVQYARGKAGDTCKAGFTQSPYGSWGIMSSGWPTDGMACASEDGLYCASNAQSGNTTCQPFLGIGQACKQSLHTLRDELTVEGVVADKGKLCAPELYCNEDQICTARKKAGEPCTDDDECLNFVCGSASGLCLPDGVMDVTADFCANPS